MVICVQGIIRILHVQRHASTSKQRNWMALMLVLPNGAYVGGDIKAHSGNVNIV